MKRCTWCKKRNAGPLDTTICVTGSLSQYPDFRRQWKPCGVCRKVLVGRVREAAGMARYECKEDAELMRVVEGKS